MRFGVRPEPYEQEDIYGYLMRVMYLNGVSTPSSLVSDELNLAKINVNFGSWSSSSLQTFMAGLTKLTNQTSYQISYLWNKCHASWAYNSKREIRSLRVKSPRVCLSCITENGSFKSIWSNITSSCCDIHHEKLVHKCPNCSEKFTWHTALFDGCNHCSIKWHSLNQKKQILNQCPSEQYFNQLTELEKIQASNYFAKCLAKVMRPYDIEPFQIIELDTDSLSVDHIRSAYQIWNSLETRTLYKANYQKYWMPISPLVANQYQDIEVPFLLNSASEFTTRECELAPVETDLVLKPVIKKLISNKHPSHTIVTPYIFAKTLKISRSDLAPLSERGLINSIKRTNLVRDKLYDIRCAERLIHSIPTFEINESASWVEVHPNDAVFVRHLTQFGCLLADVLLQNVNGYRKSESFESIIIDRTELNCWLFAQLEMNCQKSISIQKAKRAAGKLFSVMPFEELVQNGEIKLIQLPKGRIQVDGPSLFEFIASR